MTNRAHLYTNSFTVGGQVVQVVPNSVVTLYVAGSAGTTSPLPDTIYDSNAGVGTRTNPFTTDAFGNIDFYLASQKYVKIIATGVAPGGGSVTLTADFQHVHGDPADNVLSFIAPTAPLVSNLPIHAGDTYTRLAFSEGSATPGPTSDGPLINLQSRKARNAAPYGNAADYYFQGYRYGSVGQATRTCTGGGANTLTDSGVTWTVNQWAGYQVDPVGGTGGYPGTFQPRLIVSNDAHTLTVSQPWDVVPVGGSTGYIINLGGAFDQYVNITYAVDYSTARPMGNLSHGLVAVAGIATQVAGANGTLWGGLFQAVCGSVDGGLSGVEIDQLNNSGYAASRYPTTPRLTLGLNSLVQADNTVGAVAQGDAIVTSATASTLSDSLKTWTVNQWAGYQVRLLSGTGSGQTARIVSNTATQLTIFGTWSVTPNGTTHYAIDNQSAFHSAAYLLQSNGPWGAAYTGFYWGINTAKDYIQDYSPAGTGLWAPYVERWGQGQAMAGIRSGGTDAAIMRWVGTGSDILRHYAGQHDWWDVLGTVPLMQLTSGNLTLFGSAGSLVEADFDTATAVNNRTMFRTSNGATNSTTSVGAKARGSSTQADFTAYGHGTPSAAPVAAILRATATEAQIRSDSPGGSYQDLAFYANNARRGYFKASDGHFYTSGDARVGGGIYPSGASIVGYRILVDFQNRVNGTDYNLGALAQGWLLVINHSDVQAVTFGSAFNLTGMQGDTAGFAATDAGAVVRVFASGGNLHLRNSKGADKIISVAVMGQ